ncbi:MAG: hypothetical protein V4509_00705 [Patescibacteria group bacterium]
MIDYTGKENHIPTGEERVVYRGTKVPAKGTRLPEVKISEEKTTDVPTISSEVKSKPKRSIKTVRVGLKKLFKKKKVV